LKTSTRRDSCCEKAGWRTSPRSVDGWYIVHKKLKALYQSKAVEMSIARHHAEWLSLVEVSGPFLSMPVLLEAFPTGLEAHDPDHHRLLRLAHDEWEAKHDPATHTAWVRFVLATSLDYSAQVLVEGQVSRRRSRPRLPSIMKSCARTSC